MKIRHSNFPLLIVICVLFFVACKENFEDNSILVENTTAVSLTDSYSIPVDTAIKSLNAFLESEKTRSDEARIIGSVFAIPYYKVATRSNSDSLKCENLLYVANFEDNKGYAVLAADYRISEKVIAITDEGNISTNSLNSAMQLGNSSIADRPIIKGYPTTGPGFLTLPEYGDELFMNPNTVDLYIPSEGDTLAGNYELDDDEILDFEDCNSDGNITQTYSLGLCVNYAENEIQGEHDHEKLKGYDENEDELGGGGGASPKKLEEKEEKLGWNDVKKTESLLSHFTRWRQRAEGHPFNMFYPIKRRYLFFGKSKVAPAGCFPMAIAKIQTLFEKPKILQYNNITIDWAGIKRSLYPQDIDAISAAALFKLICDGCDCWCFYNGTFTFPSKAVAYLKFWGFKNVRKDKYNFDRVTEMIDAKKPLIIYSIPGINIFSSHSWNIDGYKIKERKVIHKYYLEKTLVKTTESIETCKMVHCDFGWGGSCNGYYVSGVFKLNDPNSEKDGYGAKENKTNFNNYIHLITY